MTDRPEPPCVLCHLRERQYGRTVCDPCWIETVDRAWSAVATLHDCARFFGWPNQVSGWLQDLSAELEAQRRR